MNIFKELYNGNISEIDRRRKDINKDNINKNIQSYNEIKEKLGNENNYLMEEFLDVHEEEHDKDLIEKYAQGFKIRLLIGIEVGNIEF